MEKKIKIGLILLAFVVVLSGILLTTFQRGEPGSICFIDSQCHCPTGFDPICDKGKCKCTGGNFKIPHSKWCEIDADCQWKCGYGCVNRNAKLEKISEDIKYDCYHPKIFIRQPRLRWLAYKIVKM